MPDTYAVTAPEDGGIMDRLDDLLDRSTPCVSPIEQSDLALMTADARREASPQPVRARRLAWAGGALALLMLRAWIGERG